MTIRNRLTMIYTVIVALILLALSLFVFYLVKLNFHKVFFEKLENRAEITAQVFLEKDEVSAAIFKDFEARYSQTLPGEVIRLYDKNNQPAFIEESKEGAYPADLINRVRKEKKVEIDDGKKQIVGIYYFDNQGEFVILASAEDEAGAHSLAFTRNTLLTGYIISLIVVFISGRFLSKQVLQPMSGIVRNVNRITVSNLHLRLDEGKGKDEIAELSITFNNMLERLEQAFETEKNFVDNASHQLRTPLASIIVELEVALTKTRSIEEYQALLASILTESEKLNHIITGLLDMAQINRDESALMTGIIRLDELIWDIRDKITREIPESKVMIALANLPSDSEELVIHGNKHLLDIALYNLIENACKFSGNQDVHVQLLSSSNGTLITIRDQGIGIPPEELQQVNKSFYRAKNASAFKGSGIGLSLSEKIIKMHKASFEIESGIGKGTTIKILFPKETV
ncbi:MAG TPA: ATP-binding protein [Bacteroidia bacterium]|jgi:signal transduction histidine kinase|nr:ATP-binding protein [Bacteroidia bacterium]